MMSELYVTVLRCNLTQKSINYRWAEKLHTYVFIIALLCLNSLELIQCYYIRPLLKVNHYVLHSCKQRNLAIEMEITQAHRELELITQRIEFLSHFFWIVPIRFDGWFPKWVSSYLQGACWSKMNNWTQALTCIICVNNFKVALISWELRKWIA